MAFGETLEALKQIKIRIVYRVTCGVCADLYCLNRMVSYYYIQAEPLDH